MADQPDILERIDSFASLEKGWDSYGGEAITPEAIAAARRIFVSPTSNGGVEFEWKSVNGEDTVIFTIGPDGLLAESYTDIDGHEIEAERGQGATGQTRDQEHDE